MKEARKLLGKQSEGLIDAEIELVIEALEHAAKEQLGIKVFYVQDTQ